MRPTVTVKPFPRFLSRRGCGRLSLDSTSILHHVISNNETHATWPHHHSTWPNYFPRDLSLAYHCVGADGTPFSCASHVYSCKHLTTWPTVVFFFSVTMTHSVWPSMTGTRLHVAQTVKGLAVCAAVTWSASPRIFWGSVSS